MIAGIFWAVFAGVILGFYAMPEKFTKGYNYENTWGMFFLTAMIIFPFLASLIFIDGAVEVYSSISGTVFLKMFISSFLWGVGMMLWGKAINHIGLSLGFSLFIGTIILVGSLLPFIEDGLPETNVLVPIMIGIIVVLVGVIFNGKAGLERALTDTQAEGSEKKGSMATGILIAVVGGLLCTGFSYANAAGRPEIQAAVEAQGNAEWIAGIAVMSVIYFVGGLFTVSYFIVQLTRTKHWGAFRTGKFGRNTGLTTIMAVFNFGASIAFALAAFKLGSAGNTVGYAIFNTVSVAIAGIGGLVTGEWKTASKKARTYLYVGISGMMLGVVIIAWANSLAM